MRRRLTAAKNWSSTASPGRGHSGRSDDFASEAGPKGRGDARATRIADRCPETFDFLPRMILPWSRPLRPPPRRLARPQSSRRCFVPGAGRSKLPNTTSLRWLASPCSSFDGEDAVSPHGRSPESGELRKRLTPLQYSITQEADTERQFTGIHWNRHGDGIYRGTGRWRSWPSCPSGRWARPPSSTSSPSAASAVADHADAVLDRRSRPPGISNRSTSQRP